MQIQPKLKEACEYINAFNLMAWTQVPASDWTEFCICAIHATVESLLIWQKLSTQEIVDLPNLVRSITWSYCLNCPLRDSAQVIRTRWWAIETICHIRKHSAICASCTDFTNKTVIFGQLYIPSCGVYSPTAHSLPSEIEVRNLDRTMLCKRIWQARDLCQSPKCSVKTYSSISVMSQINAWPAVSGLVYVRRICNGTEITVISSLYFARW